MPFRQRISLLLLPLLLQNIQILVICTSPEEMMLTNKKILMNQSEISSPLAIASSNIDVNSYTDEDFNGMEQIEDLSDADGVPAAVHRWRRHIGSVAAFRGLPNTNTWPSQPPQTAPLISRSRETPSWKEKSYVADSSWRAASRGQRAAFEGINKDKRYPDTDNEEAITNRESNMAITNNKYNHFIPMAALGQHKQYEITAPTHNEARVRAINKLLRLLSEIQRNSNLRARNRNFLENAALNNGFPTAQRTKPSQQFKGSTAIPLPGKRPSVDQFVSPLVYYNVPKGSSIRDIISQTKDQESDEEQESINAMDNDDSDDQDDYQANTSDETWKPDKRHIASVARTGWIRHSRLYDGLNKSSL